MMGLGEKVAIVTGATEGIGLAISERLAAEGTRLVLVARRAGPGEELVQRLGADRAVFIAGDVVDRATAARAVDAAAATFGGLHVLVNNAALDHVRSLVEISEQEARDLFDVNFFGAFHMLQAAGARMLESGGGSIVNITSRLASIGVPQMALYSAAKGALLSLTRGAAVEWASRGVRVNAVAPGPTVTPLINAWFAEQEDPVAFRREVELTIPQHRIGSAEEVAATVAFLASDEATHITGASIAIDGGYTAA
jgi:NAD(P)-dependent dehydrogenase (short-subunit alcohol dehydrogenase family)